MSARSLTRPLEALVAGLALLLGVTLWGTPADAHQAAEVAGRVTVDPTGTVSPTLAKRGKLGLSLAHTADGRIRVKWGPTAHLANIRHYIVQVSPSRTMTHKMRSYRVSRRANAKVVPHAFGATRASGNYSFVRVVAVRTSGARGGSLTKWIQAPVGSPCTAAPEDRLTVASFNVRTWNAEKPGQPLSWDHRGPNVIAEILSSGARAIAIQEASGAPNTGFGPKPQYAWILDRLNADDPDAGAQWVDALTAQDYKPPKGRTPGHIGTRVFYDASKYTELNAGLARIIDSGVAKDSLVPWARLQSVSGTQAPFVLTSNHLTLGGVNALADWNARGRQAAKTITVARDLQTLYGDQVVLAGDLNSTANTKPYNNVHLAFMQAGFYDTYATADLAGGEYPTTSEFKFPMYRTPLRRDYILTLGPAKGGCGYRNQTYHTTAQAASDHFLQRSLVPLPPKT